MEAGLEYPFKLGRHEPGLGVIEHRYPNVFEVDACETAPSLAIAAESRQIDLVARISGRFAAPLRVIYVLLVPFAGYSEGRYELAERFDHQTLEVFLDRYREFFERDARHHLVVGDLDDSRRLTYDQHNFICVIGPTEEIRSTIEREGFVAGSVALPIPHSHHHHPEFDSLGVRLLTEYQWSFSPLLESD